MGACPPTYIAHFHELRFLRWLRLPRTKEAQVSSSLKTVSFEAQTSLRNFQSLYDIKFMVGDQMTSWCFNG